MDFTNVMHSELNFKGVIDMVDWRQGRFTFPKKSVTKAKHGKRNECTGE